MLGGQNQYDLYILSYGLNPYRDMTLQSYQYLRECPEVYVMADRQLFSFLESHGIRYTDITHLYETGMRREQIYQNIANFIIKRASSGSGICYLTYGNPMLFDRPCQLILERAKKLGLSTCLIPALSFLDAILTNLQISIDTRGLAVYEATRLVLENIEIDNRVPCFIAQAGSFANMYARGNEANKQDTLHPLVNYLRRFYPADHLITLCDSDETGQDLLSCNIPLCLLPLLADGITNATTLYIPAKTTFKSTNQSS